MNDSFNTYIQNDSFYQPTPEPTPMEKRSIRKLYNSVGGTMICQYILVFVLFYIAYFILTGMGLIETTYNDEGYPIVGFWECTIMFCAPAVSSVIMYFIYSGMHHIKLSSLLNTEKVTGSFILKAVLATFFFHQVGMILEYGVAIVLSVLGLDTPSLNYELDNTIQTTLMNLFSSVILAPIAEELFFRGVVLKSLSKVSQRFAIIMSAVFFGLMHGNPYQAVMATLVGLALGYITVRSNSLIPSIICHMAMNTMASISDIAGYFNDGLAEGVYYVTSFVEFSVGVIGFVYILKHHGIHLPPYTDYHKKRTLPIMITSAGMIIITAIYLWDIITSVEPIAEEEQIIETAVRAIFRI